MSQEKGDFDQAMPASTPASKPRLPWLWLVLAAIAATLFFRSALTTRTPERIKLASLSLKPLAFASDSLTLDDLKGKVVLLNFWGTWCPPCREELPHIAELARHYEGNSRCRVVAVSCGSGTPDPLSSLPELKKRTDELLSTMQIKLAVYADPDGHTRRAVNQAVGFGGYPTTLVLDRQGVIRKVWAGYAPGAEEEMAWIVASLLADAST
jgi:thiol-disulfide isomerase/thioredoxin